MGSYGARFYIPPFANPVDPNVDPLVWTEQQLYGSMMAVMLEKGGKIGVESAATYPGEFMPTFNYIPCWHNICGMLTESASAKLATPNYVHYHQLRPSRRGRPEYRAQMGFPHPWPGGWWRLRDIVEQQKIASLATLRVAAKFREMILRNMYKKARRSIDAGKTEPPYAFIIKPEQHDELTVYKLLKLLMDMDVAVSRSTREFKADGVTSDIALRPLHLQHRRVHGRRPPRGRGPLRRLLRGGALHKVPEGLRGRSPRRVAARLPL
jgi:hypothetical protein